MADQWEYLVITRKRVTAVISIIQWDYDIEQHLPQIGIDGWELMNVTTTITENHGMVTTPREERWIFKRRRPTTPTTP